MISLLPSRFRSPNDSGRNHPRTPIGAVVGSHRSRPIRCDSDLLRMLRATVLLPLNRDWVQRWQLELR